MKPIDFTIPAVGVLATNGQPNAQEVFDKLWYLQDRRDRLLKRAAELHAQKEAVIAGIGRTDFTRGYDVEFRVAPKHAAKVYEDVAAQQQEHIESILQTIATWARKQLKEQRA